MIKTKFYFMYYYVIRFSNLAYLFISLQFKPKIIPNAEKQCSQISLKAPPDQCTTHLRAIVVIKVVSMQTAAFYHTCDNSVNNELISMYTFFTKVVKC